MPVPLAPQATNVDAPPVVLKPVRKPAMPRNSSVGLDVKSRKEGAQAIAVPSISPPESKVLPHQSQMKKITRRSSKPIINWFQRKLAGTVRPRRASDTEDRGQRVAAQSPNLKEKHRRSSMPISMMSRNPPARAGQKHKFKSSYPSTTSRRNTISLNDDDVESTNDGVNSGSEDGQRSSPARDSTWSPASFFEADEDASVRPLPPSSPPSPSPSRSSSSYLSDPRTFRSMAASTKPTTLLSIDLTGGGMAHIAQAPPTPTSAHRSPGFIRTHSAGPSGGSITFSAIPPPSPSSQSPSSAGHATSRSGVHLTCQAPQHTTHHPRNNPRPSSPPLDDASVLTLASSAFGMPNARIGAAALALSGRTSFADDSISHFSRGAGLGDSTSHFLLGDMDDERLERERDTEQDVDASVRALRPRSSRRGSWASEESGWSTGSGYDGTVPLSADVTKDRSLWTGSYRTGGVSLENEEREVEEEEETEEPGTATEGATEFSLETHASPGHSWIGDVASSNEPISSPENADLETPPQKEFKGADISRGDEHLLEQTQSGELSASKTEFETPKRRPIALAEPDALPIPSTLSTDVPDEEVSAGHASDSTAQDKAEPSKE